MQYTRFLRQAVAAAAVSGLSLLSACSSKKFVRDIPLDMQATPPASTQVSANRVITVRWPAVIPPALHPAVAENYRRYYLAETGYDTPTADLTTFASFLEPSSTLYAAELYWALRRAAPSVTVLLEPHAIQVGANGRLTSAPLVDPLPYPDIATHLWAASAPGTPLPLIVSIFMFSVQASPLKSVGNCGLLMTTIDTEPLRQGLPSPATDCAQQGFDPAPGGAWATSNWLLDGEMRDKSNSFLAERATSKALPLNTDATFVAPAFFEGVAGPFFATPSDYVQRSRASGPGSAETMVLNRLVENYAAIALSGLNAIPATSVGQADNRILARYAAVYDPALATKLEAGTVLSPSEQRNLQLVQRLQNQERQVRAKRDEAIAREILTGSFGESFRRARDDAYAQYGSKMLKMWAVTASSIALGSAMHESAVSGLDVLAANNAAFDSFNTGMEETGKAYVSRIAPSLRSLDKASLSLLDSSVSVAVSDQSALRAALVNIYTKYRVKDGKTSR